MMSLSNLSSEEAFNVYCVCGGFGFPMGTASTNRIRLIGKCLQSSGIPFHVYHIGPSPFKENSKKRGEYEGLTFEYLSPSVKWPSLKMIRTLYYLWGCLHLIFRLNRHRSNSIIYVYYQGDFANFWVLLLCRLMKIPAVQEACEWWPGTLDAPLFSEWIYRNIMFRWSNGAMPISHEILRRILNITGPDYSVCLVPVLVDPVGSNIQPQEDLHDAPLDMVFLWCGMVDGYKRDVLFLIDALAKLQSPAGKNARLLIAGSCTDKFREELLSYAGSKHLSQDRIDITGYVSDAQLWKYCTQATALLMPLWDDDRSMTRFPTKLGQYVAAGQPIVTAQVGEINHFLTEDTAMFYKPGDAGDLAAGLDNLLNNESLRRRLASRASREVLPKIDFRSNAERISAWFTKIYGGFRDV